MKQDEFRDLAGQVCPACRTTSPGIVTIKDDEWRDDGKYVADCQCGACGSTWSNVWVLAGFTGLSPSTALHD